jgi:hypothetical protein
MWKEGPKTLEAQLGKRRPLKSKILLDHLFSLHLF